MVSRYHVDWQIKKTVNTYDVSDVYGEFKLATVAVRVRIQLDFLSTDVIVMPTNNADNFKLK